MYIFYCDVTGLCALLLLLLTKQRCRAETLPIPSATKACSSRFKDTTHTLDRRQLTATSACSANSLRRRRCKPTAHCNKSCDHAHVAMLCSCSRDQTLEMGTSFKPTISSTCLFSNYIQTPIYQFFSRSRPTERLNSVTLVDGFAKTRDVDLPRFVEALL